MSIKNWQLLMRQSEEIKSLSESGCWDEALNLGGGLERSLHAFFETEIDNLPPDELQKIKYEGEMLMANISLIMKMAEVEKRKLNLEAGKHVQGKKGISAYKNA